MLAVQQHMIGYGHCRIDLEGSESKFLDFYKEEDDDFDKDDDGEEIGRDEDDSEAPQSESTGGDGNVIGEQVRDDGKRSVMTDNNTLRLSSGKILSNRSAGPLPRINRRPLAEPKSQRRGGDPGLLLESLMSDHPHDTMDSGTDATSPEPSSSSMPTTTDAPRPGPSTSQVALSRIERRALTHHHGAGALTVALPQISQGDRASLAHLSPAEQHATIVKQFRQQDKAKHGERKYWSKLTSSPGVT